MFKWSELEDAHGGHLSDGEKIVSQSQDTGENTVTLTLEKSHDSTFASNQQKVHSIDTGDLPGANPHSSLESDLDHEGESRSYTLDFDKDAANVSFRVNDIDFDSTVEILAYDADGNAVPVDMTAGGGVTLQDNDGVAGNETAISNGGGAADTSPTYSALVSIGGPVSKIVITHTQDGDSNSGVNVTDIYFDTLVSEAGAPGDDFIDGGVGDDYIEGNAGDDELIGGEGADAIFGGADADLIKGGEGDTVDGGAAGDDHDVLDLTGQGPFFLAGPDGTGLPVPDSNGNGIDGTVIFVDGDGNPTGDTLSFTEIEEIIGEEVNRDPEANDDTAEVDEDGSVDIPVLLNDTDADGDDLTVTGATADNGTVTINPDGTLTYEPDENFNGTDTITYTVDDGNGGTDEATVTVTVNPVNDDPVANDDTASTDFNTPVDIPVLLNDTDVDGDDLTVSEATSDDGDVTINPDGTLTFEPQMGFSGEATITYTVDDGNGGTDEATVTVTVGEPPLDGTVEGTAGDDIIDDGYLGDPEGDRVDNEDAILPGDTGNDDLIFGFGGDDSIGAGDGDDEVYGGDGNDEIKGRSGEDTLFGDDGEDSIRGGEDDDTIFGGTGNDTLDGEGNNDIVYGDAGDDTVIGGGGEDSLFGGDGNDSILGNNNNDVIDGGADNDTIAAGASDDTVTGGTGDDSILGEAGNDSIAGNAGNDVIDGGDNADTLRGGDGEDTVLGGSGNDTAFGGDDNDLVDGGTGDDTLDGGFGDDTVLGGEGEDYITGGLGDDSIDGGDDDDSIVAGTGNDVVEGGEGDDFINAGNHDDPLPDVGYPGLYPADPVTDNDLDTVFGGAGNDIILTGDDDDVIDGGSGDDVIDAGLDDDSVTGGTGNDTIIGGEGNDEIEGNDGDDVIYGGLDDSAPDIVNIPDDIDGDGIDSEPGEDLVTDNNSDTIFGGDGNDSIFGRDDDDTLYGDAGNDYLDGGVDDDEIYGGDGEDTIVGGQGTDDQFGGLGSDTFLGGNGGDVVIGGEDPDLDGDGQSDETDVLDLTGSNVDFITYTSPDNEDGVVTFLDGSTMTFEEIENVIPCFTPGTTIATPRGERLVEELREGDRIITRDNGIQEIRWVGRKEMSGKALVANPHLKPILIKAGALGHGLPERDMLVSPNHRVLVAGDKTQLYFEESEVLAAAKHLVGSEGIHEVDVMQTSYIHFMFDRHEVVLSNGAWTESFQPGDYSLKGIGNSQRNEIFELFPELQSKQGLEGYQAARRSLKKHETQLLVK